MMAARFHEPVLLNESLNLLVTDESWLYVDGTVGGGGHAVELCKRLQGRGSLVCIDTDADALHEARQQIIPHCADALFIHAHHNNLKNALAARGIAAIGGLLLDLGVSSYQLDEGSRGFSFRVDEPLDMRMDRRNEKSARHVINTYEEKRIADLLWIYGEERFARRIAKSIVSSRPIDTTGQLRATVQEVVGGQFLTKSLARVFQAIRIEVNGELDSLRTVLRDSMDMLRPGGRIVVISYHSLEDRIVKEFFKSESATFSASGDKYIPDTPLSPGLRLLTRKPIVAGAEELQRNPRARSAKLRAAERLTD